MQSSCAHYSLLSENGQCCACGCSEMEWLARFRVWRDVSSLSIVGHSCLEGLHNILQFLGRHPLVLLTIGEDGIQDLLDAPNDGRFHGCSYLI